MEWRWGSGMVRKGEFLCARVFVFVLFGDGMDKVGSLLNEGSFSKWLLYRDRDVGLGELKRGLTSWRWGLTRPVAPSPEIIEKPRKLPRLISLISQLFSSFARRM